MGFLFGNDLLGWIFCQVTRTRRARGGLGLTLLSLLVLSSSNMAGKFHSKSPIWLDDFPAMFDYRQREGFTSRIVRMKVSADFISLLKTNLFSEIGSVCCNFNEFNWNVKPQYLDALVGTRNRMIGGKHPVQMRDARCTSKPSTIHAPLYITPAEQMMQMVHGRCGNSSDAQNSLQHLGYLNILTYTEVMVVKSKPSPNSPTINGWDKPSKNQWYMIALRTLHFH